MEKLHWYPTSNINIKQETFDIKEETTSYRIKNFDSIPDFDMDMQHKDERFELNDNKIDRNNGYNLNSKREEKQDINLSATIIQEFCEGPELLDVLHMTSNNVANNVGANFLCEFCNKSFFKKQQLENHLLIHKNIKNFICDFCSKRFVHKQQLQSHVKTHTGEKNFACDHCSKKFIHKQQLDNHLKTHTGEKNFQCETCNKKFTLKQQLKNHVNIHLGVKPFACEFCDKRFTLKQQLNNHTKIHLGLREFSCLVCSKSFTTKQQLLAHCKIHEKDKIKSDF